MVNVDVVLRKLASARAHIAAAETLFAVAKERFRSDQPRRDLATFYVFLAIQECLDLGAHWVAERDWDPVSDVGSSFDVLADHGAIDLPLADSMRQATGLRNRIAHGYTTVDHSRLFDELKNGVEALHRFLGLVAREAGI